MSRRKSVKLNVPATKTAIAAKYRSNVMFCEALGRPQSIGLVTDWSRTPPKNLPSPEEAAKMCRLLDVTPSDIITDPGDVALVQSILDAQQPKVDRVLALMQKLQSLSPENLEKVEEYMSLLAMKEGDGK